jgi:subtilisin family serine protease
VRRALLAALLVAFTVPASASAYTPTDPLVKYQWYLGQDHAFDWVVGDALPTTLSPVRVAIIDSGLDGTNPEFPKSRILAEKSFVGGNPLTDEQGHGTFVAGEIAAAIDGKGIVGIAFTAQLIIAKIAGAENIVSPDAEAAAIRWAVGHGAQVINLSLGGTRDPLHPANDEYSAVEAAAIEYAVRHNVVVVAAVGNSDSTPTSPWNWADYPAALPHVIGVSALTQAGNVPSFSNRDQIYNDISAPGQNIFSTLPLPLTAQHPTCVDQGYSDCGEDSFRQAAGTSFAAPQVAAAAALLLALRPTLRADQVSNILERSADDVNAANGCRQCAIGRDQFSGWGRLDIQKAVLAVQPTATLPPADRYEPNDDAGPEAATLTNSVKSVVATLDYWDDDIDVYRIHLAARQRLRLRLNGPPSTNTNLLLWKPGTVHVNDLRKQRLRAAQSIKPGPRQGIAYRVPTSGWYYVEVKLPTPGFGEYTLSISRT